jgi:hypothetical protein
MKTMNPGKYMEKRESLYFVAENVNWNTIMKTSIEISQKIKNRTSIKSRNLKSGNKSKGY